MDIYIHDICIYNYDSILNLKASRISLSGSALKKAMEVPDELKALFYNNVHDVVVQCKRHYSERSFEEG